eukprot:1157362-Pelagomonas_calceolata.AAC.11
MSGKPKALTGGVGLPLISAAWLLACALHLSVVSATGCLHVQLQNSSQIRGTHWGGGAAGDQRSLAACMCVAVMVVRERHARSSIMHGAFWGGLLCGGTAPQEGAWKQCVCV